MWEKVKVFWGKVGSDLADTWKRVKVFVFALAGVVVYLEFNKIKDALIAYAGKKEMRTSEKKDDKLATQEDTNNKKADALVAEAAALPFQEKPVGEDWYKKEKP